MKKVLWTVSLALVAIAAVVMTPGRSLAEHSRAQYQAQHSQPQHSEAGPLAATRSVLKRTDQVEWADYHAGSLAGPGVSGCPKAQIGCSTGVCHGYDNCCRRPLLRCGLQRIVRMLDCLLPCNRCCNSGGCGLFGNCRPHLFHRGRCGGRNVGCTTSCNSAPSCKSVPSCTTPVGHGPLSDPFIDDPMPPKPMPESAKDAGYRSMPTSYAVRNASPYKVSTSTVIARQRAIEAGLRREVTPADDRRDKVAVHKVKAMGPVPAAKAPALKSVSAEEKVAPPEMRPVEASTAPDLLPVTIRRTSAEFEIVAEAIPVNPLRN